MCGISGIFVKHSSIDLEELQSMNDKIIHRGPDNGSLHQEGSIGLGHRRLSIIDLNECSNQPMRFKDLVIVYNGEIYNFQEIREKLIHYGYEFQSNGDCEVVLKAYHYWGDEAVSHLKGMWAFAIYNKKTEELFCSRDRFGIKPFYYILDCEKFKFGSEIKQLVNENQQAHLDTVIDYLIGNYLDHEETTFFKNILQLPPGCNLKIDRYKFLASVFKYYDIYEDNQSNLSTNVETILNNSISQHLVSDVKVGSCLSGGLDSSYLNYQVARMTDQSVAIHCNSTDKKDSEKDKAELLAKSNNIKLEIVEPHFEEFLNDLDNLFLAQEQPFGDPSVYMQYRVMKKANALGLKVMLDGQGADEVFMGYPKYLGLSLWEDLQGLSIKKLIKNFKKIKANNIVSNSTILKYFVATKSNLIKRLGLLKNSSIPLKFWLRFLFKGTSHRHSRKFQYVELFEYPLQTLLRNEDRNSMWFSIEARVPYLDHELVSKSFHQDTKTKVKNGWSKNELRQVAAGKINNEIVYRRDKLGFNSPSSWLDNLDYKEIYNSKILKLIYGSSLTERWVSQLNVKLKWRLFSIAIWERIWRISV